VSEVSKIVDKSVNEWHRRPLLDHYQYLLLVGVSGRIRLVSRPGAAANGLVRLRDH